MRDQPFVVGGIAGEAAAQMVVDAALAHAVERDRHGVEQAGLVAIAQPGAPEHLEHVGRGEFRRLAEAAPHRIAFLPMRVAIWSSSASGNSGPSP
jgi:hypothetical protein